MKIVLLADDEQIEELRISIDNIDKCEMVADVETFYKIPGTDAYINLQEDAASKKYDGLNGIVLINSVINTLKETKTLPNVFRINGWNGFLSSSNWEIAGEENDFLKSIFSFLNKKYTVVADEPGFVAARVISMIINEAYFALGEKISTKEEIDIAMKLGTNYPFGPFEWCNKIGIKKIYTLLQRLSKDDSSYLPAPLLKEEATR